MDNTMITNNVKNLVKGIIGEEIFASKVKRIGDWSGKMDSPEALCEYLKQHDPIYSGSFDDIEEVYQECIVSVLADFFEENAKRIAEEQNIYIFIDDCYRHKRHWGITVYKDNNEIGYSNCGARGFRYVMFILWCRYMPTWIDECLN